MLPKSLSVAMLDENQSSKNLKATAFLVAETKRSYMVTSEPASRHIVLLTYSIMILSHILFLKQIDSGIQGLYENPATF